MKKALITGINGQDGSYLAELLLEKGYVVHGILKRNSVAETQTTRIEHIRRDLNLAYGDMTDLSSLIYVLKEVQPEEVYNLAAQSHVKISFDQPIYTAQATGVSTMNLLEAIRLIKPDVRVYQASSSEMFGNTVDEDGYQRETTPMNPVSPYGCSKVFSYHLARNYRNAYGIFVSNGILFNHESPRRGSNFVTNKVCKEAVRIKIGKTDSLALGNLDASRDWGHARDYVKAMWMILQLERPDDYVCATGVSHTVRDLVNYVFEKLDLDPESHITIDERYFRPEELDHLKGDSSKLKKACGWEPKITFEEMLDEMIEHWLDHYSESGQ
ncbi:MAG: GDP-mannose 4,6-dehydratase [Acidobacteria bacterium]|nr:MAG: GDP-mannose 4,6-dehydratase [Acidobacteriota bacterium]REK01456.1 MAG: GDP-mannose 4,6-dehydratase [Acidobacteriota bacterium]REK14412.1 MAG: GDP-mannose 4,6-dehydratase [Acidobacteriota bacterium]REK45127.1 MAG: GDP-mannose 4,6-dehydratase [Acidobacteriota bacterium]